MHARYLGAVRAAHAGQSRARMKMAGFSAECRNELSKLAINPREVPFTHSHGNLLPVNWPDVAIE